MQICSFDTEVSWNSDLQPTYILPESTIFQQSCQPRLKGKKKVSSIKSSLSNFVLTCCRLLWDLCTPLFFQQWSSKMFVDVIFFYLFFCSSTIYPVAVGASCLEAPSMVQFMSCCPTSASSLLWALLVLLFCTGHGEYTVKCLPLKALNKRRNKLVWTRCPQNDKPRVFLK